MPRLRQAIGPLIALAMAMTSGVAGADSGEAAHHGWRDARRAPGLVALEGGFPSGGARGGAEVERDSTGVFGASNCRLE